LALGGNESIGTLRLTNGTVSGSGILSVATAINAENGTLSANIGGNAGLTKTTATTVTLSGANTFSGAVAVNGGTLILTNGAALSDTAAVTLGNISGVTLQIDSNETIGSLAGGGAAGGVLALGANSLSLSGAGDTTYSGNVTGTGKLVQAGTGTLTLNRTANYTGTPTVRIESGAVRADNLGSSYGLTGDVVELAGSGAAFIVKGTANANFPLTLTALDIYQNGTLMLERGGGSASSSHTQNIPLNFRGGVLTLAYSNITGGTITYAGAANTLFANGGITGTNFTAAITAGITESGGSYSFTKAGANTLVLNGVNTYTGDTIVTGGELRIGATGALSDSSLVNVSGGALVSFLGSDTVKGLSGAGNVSVASATALTLSNTAIDTFSGAITNAGGLVKVGAGTQVLSGAANSYSGTTTVGGGTLQVSTLANSNSNSSIGSGSSVVLTNGGVLDYTGSTVAINRGVALSSGNGGIGVSNAATGLTLSGAITGTGNLVKSGLGTLTLTGANTYNGATTVSAGTLELARTGGTATLPSTTSISVAENAVLLISQSNQINNSATVSLSGGTITRGSGVSEVFGSLNITGSGILDFGTGAVGNLAFGTYQDNQQTESALLTLNNFMPGNSFTFSNALFAGDGSNIGSYFSFGTGYVNSSIIVNGGNSFTITAIPEPSTYAAAIALLGLMLWPSRKRIVRDAKKILGFTPPMRDRLARSRQ
jgi:autotransporter-associated beta strand protein